MFGGHLKLYQLLTYSFCLSSQTMKYCIYLQTETDWISLKIYILYFLIDYLRLCLTEMNKYYQWYITPLLPKAKINSRVMLLSYLGSLFTIYIVSYSWVQCQQILALGTLMQVEHTGHMHVYLSQYQKSLLYTGPYLSIVR